MYKCKATEVYIPYYYDDGTIHMNRVMRLNLLERYDPKLFRLDEFKKYGVNTVR